MAEIEQIECVAYCNTYTVFILYAVMLFNRLPDKDHVIQRLPRAKP